MSLKYERSSEALHIDVQLLLKTGPDEVAALPCCVCLQRWRHIPRRARPGLAGIRPHMQRVPLDLSVTSQQLSVTRQEWDEPTVVRRTLVPEHAGVCLESPNSRGLLIQPPPRKLLGPASDHY